MHSAKDDRRGKPQQRMYWIRARAVLLRLGRTGMFEGHSNGPRHEVLLDRKKGLTSPRSSRRVGGTTRCEWLSVGHASPNYRSELRFSECGGKEGEKSPTELQDVIRTGADEVKGGATAKRRHAVVTFLCRLPVNLCSS